jgi:hypothetical protein
MQPHYNPRCARAIVRHRLPHRTRQGVFRHAAVRVQTATALALFAALLAGCGKTEELTVHGTVTFRGEPVPVGTVTLEPGKELGGVAPTGFAVIREGRFRTQPGKGCVPGPYVARVTGFDGKPTPLEESLAAEVIGGREDRANVPVGTPLFSEYTADIEIQSTEEEIEIQVPEERALDGPSGELRD